MEVVIGKIWEHMIKSRGKSMKQMEVLLENPLSIADFPSCKPPFFRDFPGLFLSARRVSPPLQGVRATWGRTVTRTTGGPGGFWGERLAIGD